MLLRAADRSLELTERLAACLPDDREAGKITHEIGELLSQRLFGIACGYPDANDAARLAEDPVHKMLVGRDPIEGIPLASQPTLSRFENAVGPRDLYRLGETLTDLVVERHRRRLRGRARKIVVDLDVTDDPTHGAQQLALFNGFYGSWCYLPLLGFLRFNDEREQYLFTALLRPGNAPTQRGAIGLLRRIVEKLRVAFPKARLLVRLDGGFASPELFRFLDGERRVDYVVGVAKNAVLKREARPLLKEAWRLSRKSGRTEHLYGECVYWAGTWHRPRRVIFKAEIVRAEGKPPKNNPRFVVTNLLRHHPQRIYEEIYCDRGEIENRIKELHHGLEIDRTSCSRFWANQFRVLLTAAAFVLLQEIRLRAARTSLARAQVATLRERLLKVAGWIEVSVRRIVLHLPDHFAWLPEWKRVALAFGATAG